MHKFEKELYEGQIQIRDKLQFELKSDFIPLATRKHNVFTQEFYFFIPNALQINHDTYLSSDFYRDCTNFLRYKTPQFRLRDLLSETNIQSPLYRLKALTDSTQSDTVLATMEDELKLYGNIVRSAIRGRVRVLVKKLSSGQAEKEKEAVVNEILALVEEINLLKSAFHRLSSVYVERYPEGPVTEQFGYVDNFLTNVVDYQLTGLIETLQQRSFSEIDKVMKPLCNAISSQLPLIVPSNEDEMAVSSLMEEYFLYQRNILNKFILDALHLNVSRTSLKIRYGQIFSGIAAGVAMLLYLLFFIWQGTIFVIDSAPFIIATVVLYIIKDRIKEWMKLFYHSAASNYFPDYRTKIRTPSGKHTIGILKESCFFIEPDRLPADVATSRNTEFHVVLEAFKRPETVMYYKKEADIKGSIYRGKKTRRYQLNNIFRFNIHRFLEKAGNPYHNYIVLDKDTDHLVEKLLPKVYHVNIIMKNSFLDQLGAPKVEVQKFRLVLDKEGIKRIEQVNPPPELLFVED